MKKFLKYYWTKILIIITKIELNRHNVYTHFELGALITYDDYIKEYDVICDKINKLELKLKEYAN